MSVTFRLVRGDLFPDGSRLSLVTGIEKLKQLLTTWLMEEFRVDRFQPDYGSTLDSYIGRNITTRSKIEVQGEVLRVCRNFQLAQLKSFKATPSKFTRGELLEKITQVNVVESLDSIQVTIKFTTATGESGSLTQLVSV